jgi:4-amino-4-deoxy-L-arabinose transferase-like glycosyltransferase
MTKNFYKNTSPYIFFSVIIIVVFRFILTGVIPLLDKTETRYAEIARLMHETNNWIVLQIDYGIPFWAKPPLSTWLSAISFELFGVNEIAARLPSFLLSIALLIILGNLVKKSKISFYLPAFILLTTPEFLIHTGVVSTDTALCFSIALIMISFWKAITQSERWYWKYLFFIGIAIGFLSKGPLVLVLTGPPIFIWLIIQKIKIKELWSRLPWLVGILITALIAIPWYIMAEIQSPGFIDYFIVGEHFKRFLVPGWEGDLYGSGHRQPKGMIWVFLLLFLFPWIQIVFIKLWKIRKTIFKDKWVSFLVLWLFWTPLFFTLSKNILHTYILPVTIPMVLLIIYWWKDYKHKKLAIGFASILPIAAIIMLIGLETIPDFKKQMNTDKYLLTQISNKALPILFWKKVSYSSEFYTKGKAETVTNKLQLDSITKQENTFYFLIENKKKKEVPSVYYEQMKLLDSNKKRSIYLFDNKMK